MRHFIFPLLAAVIGLSLATYWAGIEGLITALLLIALEIGFSFDNAVVNATVLQHMDKKWQQRFLTWGMLICVFGMYYLFPLLIVSLASGMPIYEAAQLAFTNQQAYGEHITAAHPAISAFGGMFLLMVFLRFVCDEAKTIHWIGPLEQKLAQLGRLESIEVALALVLLLALHALLPEMQQASILVAGVSGIALYLVVHAACTWLAAPGAAALTGMAAFIYLQVLDASFSLDAVIGAFALSTDLVLILIGLTIGAFFVRALTLHLVQHGTLNRYIYLEHGAYYAIGALALIMLAQTRVHVPEAVTGLIGLGLIGLAFISSLRRRKS